MALNVVMYGPPGAGKGTQASRLAQARGIPKISTGDILRVAVEAQTELGRKAKVTMDAGELVDDDVMVGIVQERVGRADTQSGFVLDGFPRTVVQAVALDGILTNRDDVTVIELAVPDDQLVRRLSRRRVCAACDAIVSTGEGEAPTTCATCGGAMIQRSDDREEVVRERLKVYSKQTAPVLEFYRSRADFRSVNGSQTPDGVAAAVRTAIDEVSGGRP